VVSVILHEFCVLLRAGIHEFGVMGSTCYDTEVVFGKCASESVSLNSVDLTFRNSPVLICELIHVKSPIQLFSEPFCPGLSPT